MYVLNNALSWGGGAQSEPIPGQFCRPCKVFSFLVPGDNPRLSQYTPPTPMHWQLTKKRVWFLKLNKGVNKVTVLTFQSNVCVQLYQDAVILLAKHVGRKQQWTSPPLNLWGHIGIDVFFKRLVNYFKKRKKIWSTSCHGGKYLMSTHKNLKQPLIHKITSTHIPCQLPSQHHFVVCTGVSFYKIPSQARHHQLLPSFLWSEWRQGNGETSPLDEYHRLRL